MSASGSTVFRIPGVSETPGVRGGPPTGVQSLSGFGRVKHSVRLAASHSESSVVEVDATPGSDIVVLQIAGGPVLVLHPENARDLLIAQGTESRSRSSTAGVDGVDVPIQLGWNGIRVAANARGRRGAIGQALLSSFKVVAATADSSLAALTADALVEKFDAQSGRAVFRLRDDNFSERQRIEEIPARADGLLTLVLIHGTFSSTEGTFLRLWQQHLRRVADLFRHYDNQGASLRNAETELNASSLVALGPAKQALKNLESLCILQATPERENLCGSACKRVALLLQHTGAGIDDVHKVIARMTAHYRTACELAKAIPDFDMIYPALNVAAAQLVSAERIEDGLLVQVRAVTEERTRAKPEFWSVAAGIELTFWEALAEGKVRDRFSHSQTLSTISITACQTFRNGNRYTIKPCSSAAPSSAIRTRTMATRPPPRKSYPSCSTSHIGGISANPAQRRRLMNSNARSYVEQLEIPDVRGVRGAGVEEIAEVAFAAGREHAAVVGSVSTR